MLKKISFVVPFVICSFIYPSIFATQNIKIYKNGYDARPQKSSRSLMTLDPNNNFQSNDNEQTFKHPPISDASSHDEDFPYYSFPKVRVSNISTGFSFLSMNVSNLNVASWPTDQWMSFAQCSTGDQPYISTDLYVGLTKNWNSISIDTQGNNFNITNIVSQKMQVSGEYGTFGQQIEVVDVDVPFFVKPIKSYPVNYSQNPVQTYGVHYETVDDININISGQIFTKGTVTVKIDLCFVDLDQTQNFDPQNSAWATKDIRDYIQLKFDGFNPTIRFTHKIGYFYCFSLSMTDEDGDSKPLTYKANSPLYRYDNIDLYTNGFSAFYIDIGSFNIIWTDRVTIKYYGGDASYTFDETSFRMTLNNGDPIINANDYEWCKALYRFKIVPELITDSGAIPISPPICDLYNKPDHFSQFTITFWWWDKYYNSDFTNPDPNGKAYIKLVNPYDIVEGQPRNLGLLEADALTI